MLLVPLHAIPPAHWKPLIHMIRSFRRGTPGRTSAPARACAASSRRLRDELRTAVVGRLPRERLRPEAGDEGAMLVAALRQVGEEGGIPVGEAHELDPQMAIFLFEDASTAVRNASMRKLLDQGAEPNDLRSLEDLVTTLGRGAGRGLGGPPDQAPRPPPPAPPRGRAAAPARG